MRSRYVCRVIRTIWIFSPVGLALMLEAEAPPFNRTSNISTSEAASCRIAERPEGAIIVRCPIANYLSPFPNTLATRCIWVFVYLAISWSASSHASLGDFLDFTSSGERKFVQGSWHRAFWIRRIPLSHAHLLSELHGFDWLKVHSSLCKLLCSVGWRIWGWHHNLAKLKRCFW